jgi:hypothetical protein
MYEIKFRVRQIEQSNRKQIKVTMDGVENTMDTAYIYLSVTDEIPHLGAEFMATFQRLHDSMKGSSGLA